MSLLRKYGRSRLFLNPNNYQNCQIINKHYIDLSISCITIFLSVWSVRKERTRKRATAFVCVERVFLKGRSTVFESLVKNQSSRAVRPKKTRWNPETKLLTKQKQITAGQQREARVQKETRKHT